MDVAASAASARPHSTTARPALRRTSVISCRRGEQPAVHEVSSRFSKVSAPAEPEPVFPNDFADFRDSKQTRSNFVLTTTWNHSFTTTMVNEFRYTFGNRTFTTRGLGTGSGKNGELGVPNVDPEFFATVDLTGYTRLGAGNQERIQKPIRTHQVVNNTYWFKGAHSVKWSMEYRFSRNPDDFNSSAGGRFGFNNRVTGDGLAQLLLGWTTRGHLVDTDILNTRRLLGGFCPGQLEGQ